MSWGKPMLCRWNCNSCRSQISIYDSGINPFYAPHQLFRLDDPPPTRYPSEFQACVETSHFNFPAFVDVVLPKSVT